MQGLYPIVRRKRVPLVVAEGERRKAEAPQAAPVAAVEPPAVLPPVEGVEAERTPAGTPAPLPRAEAAELGFVPPTPAGGKERRAQRQA